MERYTIKQLVENKKIHLKIHLFCLQKFTATYFILRPIQQLDEEAEMLRVDS